MSGVTHQPGVKFSRNSNEWHGSMSSKVLVLDITYFLYTLGSIAFTEYSLTVHCGMQSQSS